MKKRTPLVVTSLFVSLSLWACKPEAQPEQAPAQAPQAATRAPAAQSFKASPEQAAAGQCGADLDCLIAKAKDCSPASGSIVHSRELGGVRQVQTWTQTIVGKVAAEPTAEKPQDKPTVENQAAAEQGASLCEFRRDLIGLTVQVSDQMRQAIIAQGGNASEIDALEKNPLAAVKAKGQDQVLCKFSAADLVNVLNTIKQGRFNPSAQPGCSFPRAPKQAKPVAVPGAAPSTPAAPAAAKAQANEVPQAPGQ